MSADHAAWENDIGDGGALPLLKEALRGCTDETVRLATAEAACLAFGVPWMTRRHALAADTLSLEGMAAFQRVWADESAGE